MTIESRQSAAGHWAGGPPIRSIQWEVIVEQNPEGPHPFAQAKGGRTSRKSRGGLDSWRIFGEFPLDKPKTLLYHCSMYSQLIITRLFSHIAYLTPSPSSTYHHIPSVST